MVGAIAVWPRFPSQGATLVPLVPGAGYDRRKYVWKLLYIYMLGYEIEFGHKQAADLIPLPK